MVIYVICLTTYYVLNDVIYVCQSVIILYIYIFSIYGSDFVSKNSITHVTSNRRYNSHIHANLIVYPNNESIDHTYVLRTKMTLDHFCCICFFFVNRSIYIDADTHIYTCTLTL
jgi:hypothetical protein